MPTLTEGRARIGNCPRCDEPTIETYCDGIHDRLSRFSVPLKDALILGKYGRIVFNVWKGVSGLYVAYWHPSESRPERGWLFNGHFCIGRR